MMQYNWQNRLTCDVDAVCWLFTSYGDIPEAEMEQQHLLAGNFKTVFVSKEAL